MKKVLITGATGMVGQLVLKYCLDAEDIAQVVSLSRRSTQIMVQTIYRKPDQQILENADVLAFLEGQH